MADIRFWCPHCGKKLGVDERGIGLTISCPDCHKSLEIPSMAGKKDSSSQPSYSSKEQATLRITLPRSRWWRFLDPVVLATGLMALLAGLVCLYYNGLWAASAVLMLPLLAAMALFLRRRFVFGVALLVISAIPQAFSLYRLMSPKEEPVAQKDEPAVGQPPAPPPAVSEEPVVEAQMLAEEDIPVTIKPAVEPPAPDAAAELSPVSAPGIEPLPVVPEPASVAGPRPPVVARPPPRPVPVAPKTGVPVQLPFVVYGECTDSFQPYCPSGWMGNILAIDQNDCWEEHPHSGQTCIRVHYEARGKWAGVAWQDPPNNWGDMEGGYDITGAKRLTFWARGQTGQETVEFKVGLLGVGKQCKDSTRRTTGKIVLAPKWKQYSIPLDGCNLKSMITGFLWVMDGRPSPVTFYLDDIQYE